MLFTSRTFQSRRLLVLAADTFGHYGRLCLCFRRSGGVVECNLVEAKVGDLDKCRARSGFLEESWLNKLPEDAEK